MELTLPLTADDFSMSLRLHHATVTMKIAEDRTKATDGVISGVLDLDELSEDLKRWAGAFDTALCSGPALDSILSQYAQAADIMADGSQNPSATCTGISIGLGFEAQRVRFGPTAPPAEPKPHPCEGQ